MSLILSLQESDKVCKDLTISGEGVDTSKAKITLDKVTHGGFFFLHSFVCQLLNKFRLTLNLSSFTPAILKKTDVILI